MTHASDTAIAYEPGCTFRPLDDGMREFAERCRRPLRLVESGAPMVAVDRTNAEDDEELPSEKERAAVHREGQRIAGYAQRGEHRKAIRAAHRLYKRRSTARVAARRALRRHTFRDREYRPTLHELAVALRKLEVQDRALLFATPKSSGGFRPITRFTVLDRARQHLVELTFAKTLTFARCQTGVPGASMKVALQRAERQVCNRFHKFGCQIDVRRCFESVPVELMVRKFRLPSWLASNVLTLNRKEEEGRLILTSTGRGYSRTLNGMMMPGLPQGAVVSHLFAYALMSEALRDFEEQFGNEVAVVNYADNILVLGPSSDAVRLAIQYLNSRLAETTGSAYSCDLNVPVRRLCDGIDFLGMRFTRRKRRPIVRREPARMRNDPAPKMPPVIS